MNCSSIVTLHDEGLLAQPTLLAIWRTARHLMARGGQSEIILVADCADDPTLRVARAFQDEMEIDVRIIETSHREPGPARNDGIAAARYEWISIHDGDELVCESWLHAALTLLATRPNVIAHNQWSLVFGREQLLWGHPSGPSFFCEWDDFELTNPWSVQCVGPKQAFLDVPYRAFRADPVFEFEDWYWNAEVQRAGYEHIRVPDTVHGVRRKPISRDLLAKQNRKLLQPIREFSKRLD